MSHSLNWLHSLKAEILKAELSGLGLAEIKQALDLREIACIRRPCRRVGHDSRLMIFMRRCQTTQSPAPKRSEMERTG